MPSNNYFTEQRLPFATLVVCGFACDVVMSAVIGEDEEEEDEKVNVVINIRELDDVLIKDVGNNISSSGK